MTSSIILRTNLHRSAQWFRLCAVAVILCAGCSTLRNTESSEPAMVAAPSATVNATAQAAAPSATQEAPLPEKKQPEPSEEIGPTVKIRTEKNGDRVEEYRTNGRLTMVKITPERGAPYYLYDDNGDGRLDRDDAPAGIAPVYWTIYQWD